LILSNKPAQGAKNLVTLKIDDHINTIWVGILRVCARQDLMEKYLTYLNQINPLIMLAPAVTKDKFFKYLLSLPTWQQYFRFWHQLPYINDSNLIKNFRPVDELVQGLSETVEDKEEGAYNNVRSLFIPSNLYI
jgi:hypothetical protein